MPTAIAPESDLAVMKREGVYEQPSEKELIQEEIELLKDLKADPGRFFFGARPYNAIPVKGLLSEKDEMILQLETGLKKMSPAFLSSCQERGRL